MFEAKSLGQLVQLLLSHRDEQKANIDTGWTVCVCVIMGNITGET